jgi:hypothetical protein
MTDKVQIHKEICEKLNNIYKAKNADYGDSFAKVRKELGQTVTLVRLSDKLERLKKLMLKGEQQVVDESIEDTLIDLANYAIMELVERKIDTEFRQKGGKSNA